MVQIRKSVGKLSRFYLNMQMIVDELQEQEIIFRYCPGDSSERLRYVRVYREYYKPDSHQLLIVTAEEFRKKFIEKGHFL